MYRIISIVALTTLLGACGLTSGVTKTVEVNQPIPPILLLTCPEYVPFTSSSMEDVIINHTDNMAKAIVCRNRHNELSSVIQDRMLEVEE